MDQIIAWWQGVAVLFYVLIGLVLLQFILGVLVSIFVNHDFQWKRLPDFLTFYFPKVTAWILLEGLYFIPEDVLEHIPGSDTLVLFTTGFSKLTFGVIALAAVGGILSHLKALGVMPSGLASTLTQVGVPTSKSEPIAVVTETVEDSTIEVEVK